MRRVAKVDEVVCLVGRVRMMKGSILLALQLTKEALDGLKTWR